MAINYMLGLILLGFLIGLVIFITWLTILNLGSQESYELLKPIMGGLLLSLFFIVTYLFSPIQSVEYKTNIVVLTRGNEIIAFPYIDANADLLNGYYSIYTFAHIAKQNGISVKPTAGHQYLLELIEWVSFSWIVQDYPGHWQIEHEWVSGISGGAGSTSIIKEHYPKVKNIMISNLLSGNMYADIVKMRNINLDKNFSLPDKTTTNYKDHIVEIENDNVKIEIIFSGLSFMSKLGGSGLGEKLSQKLGPDIYTHSFVVKFRITPKRIRRWSVLTKQQGEWIKELAVRYDKAFSFSIMENRLKNN